MTGQRPQQYEHTAGREVLVANLARLFSVLPIFDLRHFLPKELSSHQKQTTLISAYRSYHSEQTCKPRSESIFDGFSTKRDTNFSLFQLRATDTAHE
jgi:hypothetical protein